MTMATAQPGPLTTSLRHALPVIIGCCFAVVPSQAAAQADTALTPQDTLDMRIAAWKYALGPAKPAGVDSNALICLAVREGSDPKDRDPGQIELLNVRLLGLQLLRISNCTGLEGKSLQGAMIFRQFPVARSREGQWFVAVQGPEAAILTVWFTGASGDWVPGGAGWEK